VLEAGAVKGGEGRGIEGGWAVIVDSGDGVRSTQQKYR
jgi:hypothetical protein